MKYEYLIKIMNPKTRDTRHVTVIAFCQSEANATVKSTYGKGPNDNDVTICDTKIIREIKDI